ncbi:chemotaxis protein CheX [Acetonema longum]|uniref:CheX protein (Uncharacterized ORF in chemotaxis operon) n=1 Tax=Acetonema longum DSM 6540 TaxID=1009370 RepID=F7NHI5_9FIRM|nr:chemotaxis protein CheX [Acetonema longum]EGO64532.1 CheX protein (uncharacterized ORF in chemotaxis operon) [Acetonema longum DSM 6540]
MEMGVVSPFTEAVAGVLQRFGMQQVEVGEPRTEEGLLRSQEVTALVGLTKNVKGNVAYSMSEGMAKSIASLMMSGMPVNELDAMAQSAVAEMANMVTAHAATGLEKLGYSVDITTPSLVMGDGMMVRLTHLKTHVFPVKTEKGIMDVSVGLEF